MTQSDGQSHSARRSATPRDLALVASLMQRLKAGEDLRHKKIRRIRNAIRCRDYENPLKLEIAAERVVEEIQTERQ